MNRSTRIVLWLTGGVILTLITVALVVMAVVEHSRGELDDYRNALERRGEYLDAVRLAPPPAAATGNGAPELITAVRELNKEAISPQGNKTFRVGVEISPGRVVVAHRQTQPEIMKGSMTWEQARGHLRPLEPSLQAVRTATDAPVLEIFPDYSKGFATEIVGCTESLRASLYLNYVEGLVLIHEGKIPAAIDNIEATLRLAAMLEKQHLLISQLVAASITSYAQASTWEILQSSTATEADYARLQKLWGQVDIAGAIPQILRLERAWASTVFGEPTASRLYLKSASSPPAGLPRSWGEISAAASFLTWDLFYRYSDERQTLENYQQLIDATPKNPGIGPWDPVTEVFEKQKAHLADAGISRLCTKQMFFSVQTALDRLISTQAAANLTFTALALQRFRLARGDYPASLTELRPDFLAAIPNDPFDGRPLRYRRVNNQEFSLYSIGFDRTDDGGNPATKGSRRRTLLDGKDIVWPMPAPDSGSDHAH